MGNEEITIVIEARGAKRDAYLKIDETRTPLFVMVTVAGKHLLQHFKENKIGFLPNEQQIKDISEIYRSIVDKSNRIISTGEYVFKRYNVGELTERLVLKKFPPPYNPTLEAFEAMSKMEKPRG